MSDDEANSIIRRHSSRRRAERFMGGTAGREDSEAKRQREAIEGFRQRARYSYLHEEVTHCFSTVAAATAHQKSLGVTASLWDSLEQREVDPLQAS